MLSVWLADLTYTQQTVSAEAMPLGIATLGLFASAVVDGIRLRLFKYPEELAAALQDASPDVLGLSHYVWNSALALAFAERVKAHYPSTIIVMGGPHYSVVEVEQVEFLRSHPQIDFYIVGEAEVAFAELMARLEADRSGRNAHGALASVHSIDGYGVAHTPLQRTRLSHMDMLPNAYQSGILDPFFDGTLVPIIQTNRGCPFACTFCVEGEPYYSKIAMKAPHSVEAELHYIGAMMQRILATGYGRNELIITDSNFGMYAQDDRICEVIADCQDQYGWPRYINATTGKNRRDRVLKAISRTRGAIQLTGSVQSLDSEVLENIRRKNVDTKTLVDQAARARESNSDSYSEVILGLPGDSRTAHVATIRELLDAGFDSLTMFQLSLLPGSELSTPDSRQRFAMETRFRTIPRSFGRYRMFDGELSVAEIDEVCVGLDGLSFDDYVWCRRYDFLVAILHNNGPFAGIEKFLRERFISLGDWIDVAAASDFEPDLQTTIELFLSETRSQLFLSRRELVDVVEQNIDAYIRGDVGNNEMYTYRAHAYMSSLRGLVRLGCSAARRVLLSQRDLPPDDAAFLDDYEEFILARCLGIFDPESERQIATEVRFDFPRYERGDTLESCKLSQRTTAYLVRTEEQHQQLLNFGFALGFDVRSIGRALTKSRLHHYLRHPVYAVEAPRAE